ncbi:hypothetical protein GCK72_020365 [Caenorhabditis remanei]|uniref:DUF19 domain-containing protein n=1 Tax=Caenorhabditis remanei TaxID=31234 RepID=A0A6A5GF33_CAERE|nr:hypothetical protein GCK72_020365 [Caenorhabditis remanei]KAF1753808.1 hypothetical protein GCK72_020365 [Caenorhabditis remanei]
MTLTELKACCDDRFTEWKVSSRASEISTNPEISRNMTLTELKKPCDDRFVCLENTYCYKDSYNYQILDECIEDVFQKGPMSLCVKKLREVDPTNHFQTDLFTTDCKVIYKNGKCFLPDVEKYCNPKFAPVFKQYISLRLYNLACDGRLRYRVGGNGQQNVLNQNSTEFDSANITSGRG